MKSSLASRSVPNIVIVTATIVTAAALIGLGLGLGGLRGAVPGNGAAPVSTAAQPFGETGARVQNEVNTISVVKQSLSGVVVVADSSTFGSGFFIDESGDILTNFHVVIKEDGTLRKKMTVRVKGQKVGVPFKVIGLAPQYDLALIRPVGLAQTLIKPLPLGDSGAVQVGQKAVALGHPHDMEFSVSEGAISSAERKWMFGEFQMADRGVGVLQPALQTDAAINPGNSGGPLLDSAGRVVGINAEVYMDRGRPAPGIGFAVPINTAKALLPRLKAANGGLVLAPTIGVLPGLILPQQILVESMKVISPESDFIFDVSFLRKADRSRFKLPQHGVLIGKVVPGSAAARAGLRGGSQYSYLKRYYQQKEERTLAIVVGGDVIVSADDTPVNSHQDLEAATITRKPGDTVTLEIVRDGQKRTVKLTLDQRSLRTVPFLAKPCKNPFKCDALLM